MGIENNNTDNVTDLSAFRERRELDRELNDSFTERMYSPDAMKRISEQLAVYAEQAGKLAHLIKVLEEEGQELSEETLKKIDECYDLLALPEFQLLLNQYLPASLTPAWMVIQNEIGAVKAREVMSSYEPLYSSVGKSN